ncbi:glycosyltransferase family 39 protein [Nostoc sp. UCD121]|uniref:ArnT family glycosyltransferase n=1 Tax=unclassified Nostoc TaxID=2593658 RepID=UPI0016287E89|nr:MULTISPECIES: glycosyltransferase family 39 protein [unclassified Nostoc]MBC1223432.1 glycosyltransferase family 39 protein [Nostoc sp. UCD120]MBC1275852.1 glycosyltransferase family 39 protein [Nostoc sp. UCD121]MBC1295802.1 glycosyltransferase family 39 protein [Nostoc sp. UCD122]
MFYKLHILRHIWRQTHLVGLLPYLSLLLWILPLLLFTSGHNSLMAHDEALYASRARLMFDSGNWITPWTTAHHKTPGPYWLIASFYKLFGMSDTSARLPSMIASILSLWLVYEIGKIMLGKKLAWLAAAILSVEFLWLQYSRLSTPDILMVLLVLLAILSLIKTESYPNYRYFWTFIAGLSLGLGFLARSFMIFLPIIALFPYLIWEHRRHHHLTNPFLYLGFFVGLIPTSVWLYLSWLHYGNQSFEELLKFVMQLGSENNYKNDRLFYLWNILLKAFPWAFFGLLGLFLTVRRPIPRYQLILVCFPLILFCELSLFSTRLPHYSLCLYPFIALFASVGLTWLGSIYQTGITPPLPLEKDKINILSFFGKKNLPRNLSYGFGGFGVLLVIASIGIFSWGSFDFRKYATIGLVMGLGWLILPVVWISRYHLGKKFLTARYWIAGWLIPCWLALATIGSIGLLSDYNHVLKTFLQQTAIASTLQSHPTYYVEIDQKTQVLLEFYLPIHAQQVASISQIPALSYAWIYTDQSPKLSRPYRILGTVKEYQLIQFLP